MDVSELATCPGPTYLRVGCAPEIRAQEIAPKEPVRTTSYAGLYPLERESILSQGVSLPETQQTLLS